MAAPLVAGAAALLKAAQPTLTYAQIKEILINTTEPLPSLQGKVASGGILRADKAMLAVGMLPRPDVHLPFIHMSPPAPTYRRMLFWT